MDRPVGVFKFRVMSFLLEFKYKYSPFPMGFVVEEGAVLPAGVADARSLYFDDLGPHVGQQLPAIWGGDASSQLQNL